MALTFLIVPVASAMLFREQIPSGRLIGLSLIVMGVTVSVLARS